MLDMFTVTTLSATLSVTMGAALAALSLIQKEVKGFGRIGLGFLLIGSGAVLIALRGMIPDIASIVAANVLMLLGLAAIQSGLARFTGAKGFSVLAIAVLTVTSAAALYVFGILSNDLDIRVQVMSVMFIIYCGKCATILSTPPQDGPMHISQAAALWLVVCATVVAVIRTFLVPLFPPGDNYLTAGLSQVIPSLAFLVLLIGTAACIAWMSIHRYEQLIEKLSRIDPKTGLLTRQALDAAAAPVVRRTALTDTPAAAVIFRLTGIASESTPMRHAATQFLLMGVADAMRAEAEEDTLLARYGEESFAALLPGTDAEEGKDFANRVRSRIAGLGSRHKETEQAQLEFGVAQCGADGMSWQQLMAAAIRDL